MRNLRQTKILRSQLYESHGALATHVAALRVLETENSSLKHELYNAHITNSQHVWMALAAISRGKVQETKLESLLLQVVSTVSIMDASLEEHHSALDTMATKPAGFEKQGIQHQRYLEQRLNQLDDMIMEQAEIVNAADGH